MADNDLEIELHINDQEVLSRIDSILEQKLKEACVLVMDGAKQDCPVDTGRLQGSITYAVEGNEGIVGSNVEYAPYVEAGARGRAGKHFLQNAGDRNREQILNLFRGCV